MGFRRLHVTEDGTTRISLPKKQLREDGVITEEDELVHQNAHVEQLDDKEYRVKVIDENDI